MKSILIMLSAFIPVLVFSQPYTIDWHKIAGGGGIGTGGSYQLAGTIGQSDAGVNLSGGNYSLSGGFWSLYAVQTIGAPLLSIKVTTTNTIVVYWPSPAAGFNLQVNADLGASNWTTPPESVNDDGTNKYIIVNSPGGNRYYRLKSP